MRVNWFFIKITAVARPTVAAQKGGRVHVCVCVRALIINLTAHSGFSDLQFQLKRTDKPTQSVGEGSHGGRGDRGKQDLCVCVFVLRYIDVVAVVCLDFQPVTMLIRFLCFNCARTGRMSDFRC